jgi:pyruvate/2-oxoglutarate dehydrogenase complex dihydrolipoamide dehydrogenase (E3) component
MLFCDVTGSTAAAELLDPEEWAEIMNGAFEHLIAPVYRFEGTLARLMGDAILAFFGAPISHEDDPQRAVMAGIEILNATASYRDEVRRRWGVEIEVRVGINTGLVVMGEVGADLRVDLPNQLGLDLNDVNEVIVDKAGTTNIEGVFAAGDLTDASGDLKQTITASAQGAIAATSAYAYASEHANSCEIQAMGCSLVEAD